MHYITAFVSFLAASTVLASPIVKAPVVERQVSVCAAGSDCFIRKETNDMAALVATVNVAANAFLSAAVADAPTDELISIANGAASTMLSVAAELKADANLAADVSQAVFASVYATVSNSINSLAVTFNSAASVLGSAYTGTVYNAVADVWVNIASVEAFIGKCVTVTAHPPA